VCPTELFFFFFFLMIKGISHILNIRSHQSYSSTITQQRHIKHRFGSSAGARKDTGPEACKDVKSGLLRALRLLLLARSETLVDERQNTSSCDGRANESVEFFVATDGKLEVARGYTLHA